MAKVWKKLQRSDSDYTGNVTGTVNDTSAADIKSGAVKGNLGLDESGYIKLAAPVGKGGTGLTDFADANYKNSNTTHSDVGTTKANVGLTNVLDQAQITSFVQDAIPTSLAIGDLWTDSNDGYKMYRAAAVGATTIEAGKWVLVALQKGALGLVKADVGLTNVADEAPSTLKTTMSLNNVNNTTDAGKPVSTAQATAIGYKSSMYKQDGIPDGSSATPAVLKGDLWMDTNDSNKIYIAEGDSADAVATGKWVTVKGNLALAKGDVGLGSVTNDVQIKSDGSNAPNILKNSQITLTDSGGTVTLNNAGAGTITATKIGLGNVDNTTDALKPVSTAQGVVNALKSNIASPTFTGTVAGVSKSMVGLSAVLNQAQITSFAQDGIPTSLAIGDIWTDTNDDNTMYRAASIGADAVTAGEWVEVGIQKGSLGLVKGDVGLANVENVGITIVDGALKFNTGSGAVTQSLDSDTVTDSGKVGGSTLAETKAAAVSTAESNIVGATPGLLDTLTKISASLGNDLDLEGTLVTSIATKAKSSIAIANPATAPTAEAVGQIGTYGDQMYVVQDIS